MDQVKKNETKEEELNSDICLKIAEEQTINDWIQLKGKLYIEKDEYWDNAFSFFEKRIYSRYINPIDEMLKIPSKKGEGFAIVNLQCSLIETLECFYMGWIYEYPNFKEIGSNKTFSNNQRIFESFFNNREPFKSLNIEGCDFYKNVRCALLHETQTKKGWRIKFNLNSDEVFESIGNQKIIYRDGFQKGIIKVLDELRNEIVNRKNHQLRNYFIAKFDNICKLS